MAGSRIVVGIIGHRPDRLPADAVERVAAQTGGLLAAIATAADDPWVATGLAEGADRIGAAEGLALGYRLEAILPFARAEYERDFPDSLAEFAELLDVAARVTALPGSRTDADAAYEVAGFAVLDMSDILIAIWDGGPSRGRGGTTEMIDLAIARDITVLWIDATGERAPTLHHAGRYLPAAIEAAIS